MGQEAWQALLHERLNEFVTLLVIINPVAVIPIFLLAAAGLVPAQKRQVALISVLVSFAVLAFFAFAGGFVLRHMGISIRAFQIAGGLVLFVFALSLVIGEAGSSHADDDAAGEGLFARAVYPLAIPKIAGPGAMLTIMILTDDDRHDLIEKAMTMGVLAAVLALVLAALLLAVPLMRLLGKGGENVISRVFGMFLAALAVNIVLSAAGEWLALPPL